MSRASQQYGGAFEGVFERVCLASRVVCTRMPSGCKFGRHGMLIKVKTPFDWILSYQGRVALIDTKTCAGNFGYSAITPHQVQELARHQSEGTIAGYVIHLRAQNRVGLVNAAALYLMSLSKNRGSIVASDFSRDLGTYDEFDPRQIFQL